MIAQIREGFKGFVLKLMLIVLALSFVLWGVGDIFRKSNAPLMSVGNTHYSAAEIVPLVRQQIALIERQLNYKVREDDIKNPQFQQIVLNQVINDLVIRKYADENNILISDDTLKYQIASIPMFVQDGKFNKEIFDDFLKNNNMTEVQFLDNLRQETRVSTVMTMFASWSLVPSKIKNAILDAFKQERTISLYQITEKDVNLTAKPTEEDLNKLYNERKEMFMLPERRKVEYAYITLENIKNSPVITDDMLRAEYESRKKLLTTPQKRDVLQMVFQDKIKADAARVMLDTGADFNTVADKFGIDKKSMFMGEVTQHGFSPEIGNAIFGIEEGKYSNVTQSPIGFHIFYVQKIIPAHALSFDEVKKDLQESVKSEKQFEAYSELLSNINTDSSNHMPLDEIVAKYGLKKQSIDIPGDYMADNNVEAAIKVIAQSAFSQSDTNTTSVSNIDRDKFFVVRTANIEPKTQQEFASVKSDLLKIWLKIEAAKKVTQNASNYLKEIAEGADEKQLAVKYKVSPTKKTVTRATSDITPDLLDDILAVKQGHYTNFYMIPNGVAFAKVEAIGVQKGPEADPEKISQIIVSDIANELYIAMITDLRKRYKVDVDKKIFDAMMF